MDMERIKELINQISKIVVEEKTQQEERRKRGENFNIFKVLGLSSSEVRLHSAFLAELLNPNGDHGLGDKFLQAFLDGVVHKIEGFNLFAFDTTSAKVYVEYDIGPISSDETEGGRIDILLEDKDHQTIIIENKIYAGDQQKQLLRYYNYATKSKNLSYTKGQFVLLYLTLYKSTPSEDSLGNYSDIKVEYEPIGYKQDIWEWLNHCVRISALYPGIREIINQYIINLNNLFGFMGKDSTDKMLDILTSNENVGVTIDILNNWSNIAKKIRTNFVEQIISLCELYDLSIEYDEGVLDLSQDSWIRINDKSNDYLTFRIGVLKHTNQDGFRLDFISRFPLSKDQQYKYWEQGGDPSDKNPLGWIYLWSESGMPASGRWWRWDDLETLRDMTNGRMYKFIEKQIIDIKQNKLFSKVQDIITTSLHL